MRANRVREVMMAGDTVVCGWLSSDSAYAAESLSHAGFDAIAVDLQHGMFGLDGAISLIQAVSAGPATPMARCSSLDPAMIGKLMDAGAYGIICPSVDTAAQALEFVGACRYPPTGRRSFGPSRGLLYGGSDYVERADDTIMAWAMIESVEALRNLDAILAVQGLDGVYVGPNDLALSMGLRPGTAQMPSEVAAAVELVRAAARAAGVRSGLFCASASMAAQMARLGWDLVTPGNDMAILREAVAARVATIRGPIAAGTADGGGY
jgi:4-hydroxy-2-oxoheptanedioate aldolase